VDQVFKLTHYRILHGEAGLLAELASLAKGNRPVAEARGRFEAKREEL
jgi:hypothetical protein